MGINSSIVLLALLLLFSPLKVFGSKILILAPLGSPSHKNYYVSIAKVLTQSKHQVTLVSGFKPTVSVRNMEEVVLPDVDLNIPDHMEDGYAAYFLENAYENIEICFNTLESKKAQKLFKKKYDLVILSTFFAECYFSLIHELQVPFVYASPYGSSPELDIFIGSPSFPSFLSTDSSIQTDLSFTQRMQNTLLLTFFQITLHTYNIRIDKECRSRGLCSNNMPHINHMHMNASLTLINSLSRSVEVPRPEVPTIIHAGGIDLHSPKQLPQELENWAQLTEFEGGTVFFSFGRDVKPSLIDEKDQRELLNALSRMEQNIFAKWDQDFILYKPRNIHIERWLPQQSILGDSRTVLFISAGGKQSTDEAAYHGVPVLGIPFTDQQVSNMQHLEDQHLGKSIFLSNFTLKAFRDTTDYLINDHSVREAVLRRSLLLQDVPLARGKTVVYWLEYVLRHQGAMHMRCPAANMHWYHLYNVDVWVVVVAVLVFCTLFPLWCFTKCIRRCSRRSHKEKTQ